MSRVAKQPLDPAAVAAADAALADMTGGRPLTMGPEDADLRRMWMDHYVASGGKLENEDWGEGPADEPVEECPPTEEETFAWFFSA